MLPKFLRDPHLRRKINLGSSGFPKFLNSTLELSFSITGEPRTCVLHKGKRGFGFVLRGAKAASPLMEMIPSDKCPGLQYMDDVDPGGVADMAGIVKGDFLLEVGYTFKSK